jgi:membrane associated rhomboid family serine protease
MPASIALGNATKGAIAFPVMAGRGGLEECFRYLTGSRVLTYIVPVFMVKVPAWIFLGLWFLYQLIEANFGLFSASANGGGTAFFAHVGGFVFGLLAARLLTGAGRIAAPQTQQ